MDIEAAEVALDRGDGGSDLAGVDHIDLDGTGVDAFGAELLGGLLSLDEVACTDEDGDAEMAELACGVEADALVCTGDEGDFLRFTHACFSLGKHD